MSERLALFTRFANALLPHEVDYLCAIHQFKDKENAGILELIRHNTHHPEQTFPYKISIDKRKYSNIKIWITDKLNAHDVDIYYKWLLETDRKIMEDTISPKEEDALIRLIKGFKTPPYYFIRLYEIIRNYRFYLLIRFRHQYNKIVDDFLNNYLMLYQRCIDINKILHEATIDIVSQYARNNTESRKWEEWLRSVFYDETLDGLNRYLAIVRLTLIHINYKEYERLDQLYNDLDKMLKAGEFYSRRILLNYYANRVMLHSKRNEHQKAIEYGYLSIRQHSGDYLHYVNNLCAVMLRQNQNAKALQLMQDSFGELKNTRSHHNRVGFASFYILALNKNNRQSEAASYAETFLNGYRDQIFEFRWHTFFSAYMQSLIKTENYSRLIGLARRYKIMEREQDYKNRAIYLPTLTWYYFVSAYKQLIINIDELKHQVEDSVRPLLKDEHKKRLLVGLSMELHAHVPEIFSENGSFNISLFDVPADSSEKLK